MRDGYEADRVSHVSQLQAIAEAPPEIPDLAVVDVTARTVVGSGQTDVIVTATIQINKSTPDWGIGVAIDTTLGLRLYAMNTFTMGQVLPMALGLHVVQVTLPDIRLGSGKYLISLGLGLPTGETIDRRGSAAAFDMPNDEYGAGILRIQPSLQISS